MYKNNYIFCNDPDLFLPEINKYHVIEVYAVKHNNCESLGYLVIRAVIRAFRAKDCLKSIAQLFTITTMDS